MKKTKTGLIFLAFAILLTMLPRAGEPRYSGGNGSQNRPYLVKSEADLHQLLYRLTVSPEEVAGRCFLQTENISLSEDFAFLLAQNVTLLGKYDPAGHKIYAPGGGVVTLIRRRLDKVSGDSLFQFLKPDDIILDIYKPDCEERLSGRAEEVTPYALADDARTWAWLSYVSASRGRRPDRDGPCPLKAAAAVYHGPHVAQPLVQTAPAAQAAEAPAAVRQVNLPRGVKNVYLSGVFDADSGGAEDALFSA